MVEFLVLDSSCNCVESSKFEGLVRLVESLTGLASRVGFADVVESKRLRLNERIVTLVLVVFILNL